MYIIETDRLLIRQAVTIEKNERSIQLLTKLGFTFKEHIQPSDETLCLYSKQLS